MTGGAIVQEEMWHYLTEKPMVIHQIILSIDVVWPSLQLMMLLSLTVSVFLCLHVSVRMRVCGEMFSGLVLWLFVTLCVFLTL